MGEKMVDFYKYCPLCVHQELTDIEEPCTECLAYPVNQDSHKPIMFKAKEEEQ